MVLGYTPMSKAMKDMKKWLQNTKFWVMYDKFTPKEREDWILFMQSPYHNRRAQLTELALRLQELEQAWRKGDRPELDGDGAIVKFLSVTKENGPEMDKLQGAEMQRKLLSDLAKCCEDFTRHQTAGKERPDSLTVLEWYAENGLYDHWEKEMGRLEERFAKREWEISRINLHERYRLVKAAYYHSLNLKTKPIPSLHSLDLMIGYYVAEVFRHQAEAMVNGQVGAEMPESYAYDNAVSLMHHFDLGSNNTVKIFHLVCKILMEVRRTGHYPQSLPAEISGILGILEQQFSDSGSLDERVLWNILQNYVVGMLNHHTGTSAERRPILELLNKAYERRLKTKALLPNGSLGHADFTNIITNAILLGKIEFAKEVFKEYGGIVQAEYRTIATQYNEALLAYASKDYSQANQTLQLMEAGDAYYEISRRFLSIKIVWDQKKPDLIYLDHLIHSTIAYLRRNKPFGKDRNRIYLRRLNLMSSICKAFGNQSQLDRISRVFSRAAIHDKDYLERKLLEGYAYRP